MRRKVRLTRRFTIRRLWTTSRQGCLYGLYVALFLPVTSSVFVLGNFRGAIKAAFVAHLKAGDSLQWMRGSSELTRRHLFCRLQIAC